MSAFPDADSCNVDCVRIYAKRVCDGYGLTGPGSQTWGTLGIAFEEKKSFWKLFVGLFAGLSKYQEEKRALAPHEFQEHLIVPRAASKPDRFTLWLAHNFIPLFHYVWTISIRPSLRSLWGTLLRPFSSCQLPRFRQKSTKKGDSSVLPTETPEPGERVWRHITSGLQLNMLRPCSHCLRPVFFPLSLLSFSPGCTPWA